MSNQSSRRPLKIRDVQLINTFARFLTGKKITPNQISISSTFFAAFSAGCFLLFDRHERWWLLILTGLSVRSRLLCNRFDGMVAVESGKRKHV